MKPPNVLLSGTGDLKISDFGIAKSIQDETLTATGDIIGTPAYMSPEQARAAPVDGRSDLFSVGMIAYRLLAGRNPHANDNVASSLLRVTTGPSLHVFDEVPSVPLPLEFALDHLLEKSLEMRTPSAAAGLAELQGYVDEVDARYPTLLQDAIREPERTCLKLFRDLAEHHVQSHGATAPQTALALYRATLCGPAPKASELLSQLCTQHGFQFVPSVDPRIQLATRELETQPDSPAVLRKLANLHRAQGHLFQASVYLKQYLRLRPDDNAAGLQLEELLGDEGRIMPTLLRARTGTFTAPKASAPRLADAMPMPTLGGPTVSLAPGLASHIETGGFPALERQAAQRPRSPLPRAAPVDVVELEGPSFWATHKVTLIAVGTVALVGLWLGRETLGLVQRKSADFDHALVSVEKAQSAPAAGMIEATQRSFYESGLEALRSQDFQGALDKLNFAIAADPDMTTATTTLALYGRAKAHLALGNLRQALVDFRLVKSRATPGDASYDEATREVARLTPLVEARASP
jgi:tetratricopeptide (TPR) repeat protein